MKNLEAEHVGLIGMVLMATIAIFAIYQCHTTTRKYIDNGYCEVMAQGKESPIWEKCK